MRSIASRLLVGNAVVLAAFVVLTALAVSWSVHRRAETARLERLQGLVYGILGATELDAGRLVVAAGALPERILSQPLGGLYAELVASDGRRLWQSRSSIGRTPEVRPAPIGEWTFVRLAADGAAPAVDSLQLQSAWALDGREELPFVVHVATEGGALDRELARFDATLWATLAGAALVLLAVQTLVLRRALVPLRAIGAEVRAVERGERAALSEAVPQELGPLAGSLNALLASERGRRERYRDLLDDLAHSLKTPLTILANLHGESHERGRDARDARAATIREQTERMRSTIARYLERARRPQSAVLAAPVAVRPVVERLTASIVKLHRERDARFEIDVEPSLRLRVADADLHEILGNVLENAVRHGARRVQVSARGEGPSATLTVDDDGPGFPPALVARLGERGVRADSRVPGEGLGLAAARELAESHGGALELGASPAGGARVTLRFGG